MMVLGPVPVQPAAIGADVGTGLHVLGRNLDGRKAQAPAGSTRTALTIAPGARGRCRDWLRVRPGPSHDVT